MKLTAWVAERHDDAADTRQSCNVDFLGLVHFADVLVYWVPLVDDELLHNVARVLDASDYERHAAGRVRMAPAETNAKAKVVDESATAAAKKKQQRPRKAEKFFIFLFLQNFGCEGLGSLARPYDFGSTRLLAALKKGACGGLGCRP